MNGCVINSLMKDWKINIPCEKKLKRIIKDDNITEIKLAKYKDFTIHLYMDLDKDKNLVSTISLGCDKLWDYSELSEDEAIKLYEAFVYEIKDISINELTWKLRSLVQECIDAFNYKIKFFKNFLKDYE